MTNKTAWAHLPNASHIDWVLADVEARPQAWGDAQDAARGAARDAAWHAARDAAWAAARYDAWEFAWHAVQTAARDEAWAAARAAARTAVSALVAWDHAGDLLVMTEQQLRAHIELSEDPAAVLLLPAVVARESAGKSGDSASERHAQEIAAYELTVSNLRAEIERLGKDAERIEVLERIHKSKLRTDMYMGGGINSSVIYQSTGINGHMKASGRMATVREAIDEIDAAIKEQK